jgi:hypothetical protein
MSQILIELDRTEEAALREELRALAQQATLADTQRFDGTLIVQVLATLNAVTIPLLAKVQHPDFRRPETVSQMRVDSQKYRNQASYQRRNRFLKVFNAGNPTQQVVTHFKAFSCIR